MEVILHIGMGKTGTSSIQKALEQNAVALRRQGVDYLGMWFGMLGPDFGGLSGQTAFFGSPPQEMRAHAHHFASVLAERQRTGGCSRFVLSNEGIYGEVHAVLPFVEELRRHVRLRLVAYVRDPHEWLPSAYGQWSIFHKNYEGPVRPFAEIAREQVQVYCCFQAWGEAVPDLLTVRPYLRQKNVVEDFSEVLGIALAPLPERQQARVTADEAALRIFYNTRLPGETLPWIFDEAFEGLDFQAAPVLEDVVARMLDYRETGRIVDEARPLFDYLRTRFGIDFPSAHAEIEPPPDPEALRRRLTEHLLQIVMHQADRITALETAVAALQAAPGKS
ncbi:polysaccharide biosynthesis protein (plasmid) [Cereibacter sphaeroides f. sp. denitrificans]|nr:polysaccharide biosynthesis protein [Cereibacter sphaeroides f. sp. denitrificans]